MKKQGTITKILIHAAVALIATSLASTARAGDPMDFGDFNGDGRDDKAAITNPTTITVSLANPDGSYTVSAFLSAPKNRTFTYVQVSDVNGDGVEDVYAMGPAGGTTYYYQWVGNGDGTFGSVTSGKWSWGPKGHIKGIW